MRVLFDFFFSPFAGIVPLRRLTLGAGCVALNLRFRRCLLGAAGLSEGSSSVRPYPPEPWLGEEVLRLEAKIMLQKKRAEKITEVHANVRRRLIGIASALHADCLGSIPARGRPSLEPIFLIPRLQVAMMCQGSPHPPTPKGAMWDGAS